MSKPWIHSLSSAKKWKGRPDEYLKFHNFMDSSKAHLADMRHRSILHSSFGIFLMEQVFGEVFINSENLYVSVRDIGEQHVMEDMGFIPSVQDYLQGMPMYDWLGGGAGAKRKKEENGIIEVKQNTEMRMEELIRQKELLMNLGNNFGHNDMENAVFYNNSKEY